MIAIVNVSKRQADIGPQDYEVRINRFKIAEFVHNREDGLQVCIRKASEAIDGVDITKALDESMRQELEDNLKGFYISEYHYGDPRLKITPK